MTEPTGHEWKDAVNTVDKAVLNELHKVICRQTNCSEQGVDESQCGVCAFCADAAENVVGQYLILTGAYKIPM